MARRSGSPVTRDNVTINDLSGTPLEKVYVDLSDGRRVCWS